MTESDNASLLRDVLKSRRLTQQQAATLVGMDRSQMNGYATGRLTIGEATAEKFETGFDLPAGYFKRTPETRAVTLAELAVLMYAAREAQANQLEDLHKLAGAVDALARALTGLDEFVRSVLQPPNSERGRRTHGV